MTDNKLSVFNRMVGSVLNDKTIFTLTGAGFFSAPASKKHHGNHPGGLFEHSASVSDVLADLTKKNNLKWSREISPWLVGMFHDLCKIDMYKLVDNSDENSPVQYEYNNDILLPGHGDKSIILAGQMGITLTEEEMLCIRWHMGSFDDKENWDYYSKAVERYPNVLWTHHADMIASHILNL